MSDTIHKIVTDRMIAALQRGTIPWHKPWQAAAGQPRSMSTGQPYRGINPFLLGLTAAEHGYTSPYWGTYRQITGLGGRVRQGERSTLVVFWKQAQAEQPHPQTGELTVKTVPVLRYYRVFNANQADHLPERFHPAPGDHSQISQPQAVLDGYLGRGPKLVHVAGDRADYHPATDTIRLPLRSQFCTSEGYYATAFHEAGHSTGHPARLDRPGIAAFDHFGSGKYAREELVAQMASSLLCAQPGIDTPDTFENSAGYIANWLTALGNDHKLVMTAAGHAQRACDLINQAEREPIPERELSPPAASTNDEPVPAKATAPLAGPHEANRGPGAHTAADYDRSALASPLHPAAEGAVTAPSYGSPQAPSDAECLEDAKEQTQPSRRTGDWQAEAD